LIEAKKKKEKNTIYIKYTAHKVKMKQNQATKNMLRKIPI